MKTQGQAAMEYLLVASLILLVFVPTTFIFLSNTRKSSEELTSAKLYKLGNSIINTAYEVYYQGAPAKMTLKSEMPDGVSSMYILNNWSKSINQLIITLASERGNDTFVFDSDVNINGSFTNQSYTPGLKNIVITANVSNDGTHYANIQIT